MVGRTETVCQMAFASLHWISIGCVRRIVRALTTAICTPKDMRGKHTRRPLVLWAAQLRIYINIHHGMVL